MTDELFALGTKCLSRIASQGIVSILEARRLQERSLCRSWDAMEKSRPLLRREYLGHSRHYNNHQASILSSFSFAMELGVSPNLQFPFDVHTDDGQTIRMKMSGNSSRSYCYNS